jgi:hypothetical protein
MEMEHRRRVNVQALLSSVVDCSRSSRHPYFPSRPQIHPERPSPCRQTDEDDGTDTLKLAPGCQAISGANC